MYKIALALAGLSFAASTSAAELYHLNKTAKFNYEIPVAYFFNLVTENCESGEPPAIDLNVPPIGGTVCKRPSMVTVSNIWSGRKQHCIGTSARGVRVVYSPFRSFTGPDSMQFTVKVTPPWTRAYETKI